MKKKVKLTKTDNIIRLLDSNFYVMLWKNPLGGYSSAAFKREELVNPQDENAIFDVDEKRITDGITPSQSLRELAQKVIGAKL